MALLNSLALSLVGLIALFFAVMIFGGGVGPGLGL